MLLIIIGIIVIWWLFSGSGSKKTSSRPAGTTTASTAGQAKAKEPGKNPHNIYTLTPRLPPGQCKKCGCVDCMAFAMRVAGNSLSAEQCPRLSDEALIAITGHPRKTPSFAPKELKCPDCHEAVEPDTIYCPHCGCLVKKT